MVNASLAKATRIKQLNMIISLSRILRKNWVDVTKDDIDELVFKVMERYSDQNGKETNTTWDHKKVLKSFFRWVRLGSREKLEVGDPPETKDVKIRKVRSKIVRDFGREYIEEINDLPVGTCRMKVNISTVD
jgi:integrase/recombinase XerD